MKPALAVVGIAALLVAAVAAPLVTYTTSLALFGLPHVVAELRYVDGAFRGRVPRWAIAVVGAALIAVVGLRLAGLADLIGASLAGPLELGLVAAMAAAGGVAVGGRAGALASAVTLALGWGAYASPTWTFAALAVLHNATPVGFLLDALPGRRRDVLLASAALFLVIPALIGSGLVAAALDAAGAWSPHASWLTEGGLGPQLGAYLHASLHHSPFAPHWFSAAVFAQLLHYVAVIGVLPSLQGRAPLPPWPSHRALVLGAVVVSALTLPWWDADFAATRRWYGVVASVHAWVEIPLLLVAFGRAGAR